MTCSACGHENRDTARFCLGCGAALELRCPGCGAALPAAARFCDQCGTSIAAGGTLAATVSPPGETPTGARKVVTILFADISGSTSWQDRIDPESARRVMDRVHAVLAAAVEGARGTVVKFTGDGLMAAFGVPDVSEDDAWRAVQAAAALQRDFAPIAAQVDREWTATIGLRVGVNTGEVVVTGPHDDVVGDAVNVAARLETAAGVGEIYVGAATWRLVRDRAVFEPVAPLTLKGKPDPVPAYRFVAAGATGPAVVARFVGRDDEMACLHAAFADATDSSSPRLVTIIGSAGLGKSRLAAELAATIRDRATVLEARCEAVGGSTFAPIADALRAVAQIGATADADGIVTALTAMMPADEPDRDRIAALVAALLGASPAGAPEETFWAVRRFIEALAQERPTVLVVDDLQWAEPMLLDLVEHVVEWTRGSPVLVLVLARPELREVRPGLVESGGHGASVLVLEGLPADASAQLACDVLDADRLPAPLVERVLLSSEGNPLFVRELVRMLVDDGVLTRKGGDWVQTVDADAVAVPPTIQSLLAARIDRVPYQERAVLECAAVVGKTFWRGAVAELLAPDVRDNLDVHLESLRRKQLVEPEGTYWIDEPVYRFHHVLVRDAAYRRVLKEVRADRHERHAEWLERKSATTGGDDEAVGYHLEQAYTYRRELGVAELLPLGQRAAARLAAAGRRALDRDDLAAAAALFGRALACLELGDDDRPDLLLLRCEALLAAGDVASAVPCVRELSAVAASPRLAALAVCYEGQLTNLIDPTRLAETAASVAEAAARLKELDDIGGVAKAHQVHASALARLGRVGECEAELDRALAAAREAGDRRRATAVLAGAPVAALWGPSPVTRASGRCLDVVRVLRITTSAAAVEAVSLRCQAVLEALRGRADAGRRMLGAARTSLEELGHRHGLLEVELFAGILELVAGDPVAAETPLRVAHEGFRALGVDVDAGHAAALLARACLAQGRVRDAELLTEESERLGGDALQTAIAWRSVRAEALAGRGEIDAALTLARAAAALAEPTDAPLIHADARLALATVLRAGGRDDEARAEARRALGLYEAKGATVRADAVRAFLGAATLATTSADLPVPSPSRRRRIRPNAITRLWDRMAAGEPFAALTSRDFVVFDHLFQVQGGGELLGWKEDGARDSERLATLGERHGLRRFRVTIAPGESGASAVEQLYVTRADASGLFLRAERFAVDELHLALARLLEMYAEDELPEDRRAPVLGHAAYIGATSRRSAAQLLAVDGTVVDHRLAYLGTMRGREAVQGATRNFAETMGRTRIRLQDVFGVTERVVCLEGLVEQVDPSGGPVEIRTVQVSQVGDDGLVSCVDLYGIDQLDAALARFDEVVARRDGVVIENFCTRHRDEFHRRLLAGDLDRAMELVNPDVTVEDRRSGVRMTVRGAAEFRADNAAILSVGLAEIVRTPIAVRGERLALSRYSFTGRGGLDRSAVDTLQVFESDDQGRTLRIVVFDPDDLDAATEELEERFIAGEGAPYAEILRSTADAIAAYNARDWARFRLWMADDAVSVDHQLASHGELVGPDALVEVVQMMVELSPDNRMTLVAPLFMHAEGAVGLLRFAGTDREGGGFEIWQAVVGLSRAGRNVRYEVFPPEDRDQAVARLRELLAARMNLIANSCTRAIQRHLERFMASDWEGMAAAIADDFVNEDRRRQVRTRSVGRDQEIASLRLLADIGVSESTAVPLARRGDRLALLRMLHRGRYPDGAIGEFEILVVTEVDVEGVLRAGVAYDHDDLDAAIAELDERYLAGEGAAYVGVWDLNRRMTSAYNARDWEGLRALFADDLVMIDHRSASFGTMERAEAVVDLMRGLVELSPDNYALVVADLAVEADGFACITRMTGADRYGGPFEVEQAFVGLGRDGRLARVEAFGAEAAGAAAARLRELTSSEALTPPGDAHAPLVNLSTESMQRSADDASAKGLQIENECTRVGDQQRTFTLAKDWDPFERVTAEDCVFLDRRRLFNAEINGRAALMAMVRENAVIITRADREPLATRGERLALVRLRFGVTDRLGGEAAAEALTVQEIDASGRVCRDVYYDIDDLDGAVAELEARYVAGEGAPYRYVVESAAAWTAAHNARDWTALRELLTGDVVAVDHRSVGFGTITGADDLVRFSRQLAELSPTVRMLTVQFDAISPAAGVVVRRSFGRTPEGGEFESVYRAVGTSDGETMARLEFFPLEAREAALTRFEELTSTPSGPAPNTCFRAFERGEDNAIVRRDWADLAEAVSDDVMLADRRSGLRVETRGREAFLRNAREMAGIRSMLRDLIATRGDHLALMKNTMSGHDRFGGDFEVDLLSVGECDAGGRITAIVFFDPTDLDAAFDELDTRFRAGEGAPYANVLGAAADESGIADDMVLVDHRIMGFGTSIGRDEFLRLHASLTDIAPSATRRCIAVHRLTTGGLVASTRTSGDVDGGGFDWDLIVLRIVRGERIVRTEYFDPDALDTALARFDELTAPSGPRPNRCLAVVTEARDVLLAHHYEAFGALHAADCIMEDRRTGVRVTTRGRAALIENTRGMTSVTSMPIHLVATRGERLALVGTAFVGAIAGGDFEVDAVQVVEIDESGLITRGALFDETAMDDAFAVLDDWYVEGEGAAQGAMLRAYQRGSNAYNAWDWERLRMTVTDDFVAVDHRSIGLLGEMHGRDEFVESLQKLAGMVTSGSFRVTAIEAVAGHGLLARAETRGVDLDGGTFELPWLIIAIVRDDRVARLEYFADDARDDALARFAELTS